MGKSAEARRYNKWKRKKKKGFSSRQKRVIRDNMVGYAFILPNLIGYAIFIFIPVCFSFVLSVMKWDASQAPMEFVGLANFAQIFQDEIFMKSFWNTIEYALMTVLSDPGAFSAFGRSFKQ